MTSSRIVWSIFALGFAVFLLKFFLAPAPVEESRHAPIGKIQEFSEGVMPMPELRLFVVRRAGTVYALAGIDRNTGCLVEWKLQERIFRDSCSPSSYDEQGDPLPGSLAHLPLWRPEIRLTPTGRLEMDRSWLQSLPSGNVRPLNGKNPVWNQLFDSSRLEDDPRRRDQPPYTLRLDSP